MPLILVSVQEAAKSDAGRQGPESSLEEGILLAACGANEMLPQNPDLPADVFTSCLTTPIKVLSLAAHIKPYVIPCNNISEIMRSSMNRLCVFVGNCARHFCLEAHEDTSCTDAEISWGIV